MNESGFKTRNASRLFAGLVILALGTLALLSNFGVVRIFNVWRLWPLILVAVGLAKLLQPRGTHGSRFPGGVFLAIGLWLLLQNLGVWPYSLGDLWPLLVVALGAFLVWGAFGRRREEVPANDPSRISSFSLLGGAEHRNKSQDFRGGDAFAMLGGCKLDLRQAAMKDGEAVLDVFAMWGGIEILIPREWHVVIQGAPILGSFEDKTDATGSEAGPRLVVRGAVVMGGVEIKN